jgi:hypothetical protein
LSHCRRSRLSVEVLLAIPDVLVNRRSGNRQIDRHLLRMPAVCYQLKYFLLSPGYALSNHD